MGVEIFDDVVAFVEDFVSLGVDEERAAIAPDYPAPIVDHAERRERAIAAFEAAHGDG
ncbi:hypothetical protein [Halomicrococcus sp. NG-SE-24]|uniref:hypothetical protein n=1 Tax=Halomicrococcus sp. NG-SE-24 TaxID=3436928 RepID=UPI003D98067A